MSGAQVVGAWLKQQRLAVGMTQEELAGKSGVSARAISNLERGRTTKPYPRSLRLLATALGLPDSVGSEWATRLRAGRGGNTAPEAPRQLPAAVGHFTGRGTELDALTKLVDAGGTVVISAIDGMAGIGKTALAVHTAHRLASNFPDGQLFIDLHGYTQGRDPRTPGEALDWFLRALGVAPQRIPDDTDQRAALYRQHLADRRTLIVLDNAADETQVRPLLPGSAGCVVLLTSRRRLRGLDDAHPLSLDVLPRSDAVTLLCAVAGPGRVPADDPMLSEIADLCGRLPLALRIAAALLRHRPVWSLAHLAELLRDHQRRISVLSDSERDLTTVFDLSYQNLRGEHRQLFRGLGLLPGPDTDADAAAALIGVDSATAARRLQNLVDHNLVMEHSPGRYRLHDLLRDHARSLVGHDPAPEREQALDRLLDYYQHTANRADAIVSRHPRAEPADAAPRSAPVLPDSHAALTWLRGERPNLLAALAHSTARDDDAHTVALTNGLSTILRVDGPWSQAIPLITSALRAARRLGDRSGEAAALVHLGDMRQLTSDHQGAARDLREALQLYQALGERLGQAAALTQLGQTYRSTGDFAGAARRQREALDIYRALGSRQGQALLLTRLGELQGLTANFPAAAHDFQEALELYRLLGDRQGQGNALSTLGEMRRLTGDHPGAMRDQREALEIFRTVKDRRWQAAVLTNLGETQIGVGDYPGAVSCLDEALGLYRDLDDQPGQGNALTLRGTVRRLSGDHPGATSDLQEALVLFRYIGARGSETFALNHYATLIAATGDHIQAMTYYHDALRLAREMHQLDEEALALEGIGTCHLNAGEGTTGVEYLTQAQTIFQRLGMTSDINRIETHLARS